MNKAEKNFKLYNVIVKIAGKFKNFQLLSENDATIKTDALEFASFEYGFNPNMIKVVIATTQSL